MRANLTRTVAMLVLVAGMAAPAAGQQMVVSKGAVETSLGGGAGIPLGDFADNANTGFQIGGRAGYFLNDNVAIGGQVAYERYGASDELKQLLSDLISDPSGPTLAVDADFDMLHFTAYGKYALLSGRSARPYVKAQVGVTTIKGSISAGVDQVDCSPPGCPVAEEWVTDFAAGGAVGVDMRLGEIFGAFAEALYNGVFTDGSTTQLVTLHAGIILYAN